MSNQALKTTDQMIYQSIRLLQMLTTADSHQISRAHACDELALKDDDLDLVINLVSDLCDSRTGARTVLAVDETTMQLIGDAAYLDPLRLNLDDTQVLSHVLNELNIDADTRKRVAAALCPTTTSSLENLPVAEAKRYGSHYQLLAEALEDGVRCTINYLSQNDSAPRARTIDPIKLVDMGDSVYLEAWDVKQDAERKYRLDRILTVTLTDDSVATHTSAAQRDKHFMNDAPIAVLHAAHANYAQMLTWAGIESVEAQDDGSARIYVHVSSESWLFDEVLFSAGELTIEKPRELADRLVTYAQTLHISAGV